MAAALAFVAAALCAPFAESAALVHKAKLGDTVALPCPSNDKTHRFQYWLLKNDEVIGPWNNRDLDKYRYEVWSGRLIIRGVSDVESGHYKCFSKAILGSQLKSETVELLVFRDWEDSFDNDSKVNTYRTIIAVLVILMLILIVVFGMLIRRRRSFVFQESREDSPEDAGPGFHRDNAVYKATSISLGKSSGSKERSPGKGLDAAVVVVDTDISTSFPMAN